MELPGLDVELKPVATTIPPGAVDRPLNGVLEYERALLGLGPLRPWREALVDYMARRIDRR
jgi:hypothetical protein